MSLFKKALQLTCKATVAAIEVSEHKDCFSDDTDSGFGQTSNETMYDKDNCPHPSHEKDVAYIVKN